MWGLETIKAINAEAGVKARNLRKKPCVLRSVDDVDRLGETKKLSIPHLGTACEDIDEERERIDTLFCDISGFGSPGELALTINQMKDRLKEMIGEHGPIAIALEEQGQFQGYLAVWREGAERPE